MKKLTLAVLIIFIQCAGKAQTIHRNISIDFAQKGAEIPSSMYGIFFEEIGHAGEGGLYGELLRNRSFEDNILVPTTTYQDGYMVCPHSLNYVPQRSPQTGGYSDFRIKFDTSQLQGWDLQLAGGAKATVQQTTIDPLFATAPHNLQFTIEKGSRREEVSIVNSGFPGFHYDTQGQPYHYTVFNVPQETAPYGISLQKGASYNVRIILKARGDYKGHVIARMLDAKGNILGEQVFSINKKNSWQEYKCQMLPAQTAPNGKFSLSFDAPGTVWVDFVSLMPAATFKDRPNGLRKDIATKLADLKPGFIRWPGGCIVEGMTLANRFKWKETLGDPAGRPGEFDLWGYRNSYGFGYHEYLQFCEDIGAAGMFVCNVGLSCLYRNGDYCRKDSIKYFIQDALDAIEYAVGDVHTVWGAKRAAAGHPAPFPLKFIEIGNENRFEPYNQRYDLFYAAIKEKYPQLVLISNYGIEEAAGYSTPGRHIDMIDPHWYESPSYFFEQHNLFDSIQPRPAYKMYVGEYSANQHIGAGDLEGALSEAVFAMGMERNADLVKMCSYAPLLQQIGDNTWPVNMIIYKTDSVYGRTSYYVQKMLSENRPDVNLHTTIGGEDDNKAGYASGVPLWNYSIAGYDAKNNEIVIKVINAEPNPLHSRIDLKNAGPLATEGEAIVLSAESGKMENSFAAPDKIAPATLHISGVSNVFEYEFRPYSFTILRIKKTS